MYADCANVGEAVRDRWPVQSETAGQACYRDDMKAFASKAQTRKSATQFKTGNATVVCGFAR